MREMSQIHGDKARGWMVSVSRTVRAMHGRRTVMASWMERLTYSLRQHSRNHRFCHLARSDEGYFAYFWRRCRVVSLGSAVIV
jgi:hypothetical protein